MNYRRVIQVRLALVLVLILAGPPGRVHAHHSFGAFDLEKEVLMSGTVLSFEWVSPHTWTRVVADGDTTSEVVWNFEGMSPNFLGRRGWNRRTLQAGDLIELAYYPLKDGAPGGLLLRVTLSDGTVKIMGVGRSDQDN